jgi:hypothetical protein
MNKVNISFTEKEEIFACFEDGRDGVQRRFLKRIRKALQEKSPFFKVFLDLLQKEGQLPLLWKHLQEEIPALLAVDLADGLKILQGDHQVIITSLLEKVANPLGITYDQGFGPIQLSPKEQEKWLSKVEADGFCLVAGTTEEDVGRRPHDLLEMYLVVRALKLLR